ncbi:hypothetical protein [Cytobacillus praedii]|uniref:hypothetical protein n=1 Tax=Cytobacillus praedii TaxID=1742358 RepID=UPI002E1ABF83|nr:hypothetical protein [Cytobacillus praedii]
MELLDIMGIVAILTAIASLLEKIVNVLIGFQTFIKNIKDNKKGKQKKKPSRSRGRTTRRKR